jgi:PhoD-like phosphatase
VDERGRVFSDSTSGIERREFIRLVVAAAGALGLPRSAQAQAPAPTGGEWNAGQLAHLIPTASHERFLIKASFKAPLADTPRLTVNGKSVDGVQTDPDGRFWRFDAASLQPATQYELRIADRGGAPLCDAWPLKTFPAPDANPERMRVVAFTCAGGAEGSRFRDRTFFLDMAPRRRLLGRALSFAPDALIANGDHIYGDQKTLLNKPFAKFVQERIWPEYGGALDLSVPMLHPRNRQIFLNVCDAQIPALYGTTLRSTPAFFIVDDHDYFENDEFDDRIATLPPDDYGLVAAEQTQQLYYPEFLPDPNRPVWLAGGDQARLARGTSPKFGTIRFGSLLESALYDCRRYVNYKGEHAKVVPQWTEDWLIARTRAEDTTHFFHAPSLPFAYVSGKLGDWYPDALDHNTGKMRLAEDKPGWQKGWFGQHQRLIEAIASQTKRAAVIVEGDMHATAAGKITRSADLGLAQPVHAVLAGTLGTGDLGFPSAYRRVESSPSLVLDMDEALKTTEKNGFTLIDVTPDGMTFSIYMWRPPQRVEEIDTMAPALVYEVPRKA